MYNKYIQDEIKKIEIKLQQFNVISKWLPSALISNFILFHVDEISNQAMLLSAKLPDNTTLGKCHINSDNNGLIIKLSLRQQSIYEPIIGDIIKWSPQNTTSSNEPIIIIYRESITIDLNDSMDILCG